VFDPQIVATMYYTFNENDFAGFPDIAVIAP